MYDRKTWIVLIICSGLLAMNLYFSGQNQKAEAEQAAREKAAKEAEAEDSTTYLKQAAGSTNAELTVDTPPPPTEETLVKLGNEDITFILSNIGGGIKYAEFADEFQVGSESEKVRSNRYGSGPIGALAGSKQRPDNTAYSYVEKESVPGKQAAYVAKLSSGLGVAKTYTLETSDKPGAPYLINMKLEVKNTGESAIDLEDWSIFLGESSPLYVKEVPSQTGFFWREDGDMHFEHGGKFKKGFLGWRKARSVIQSPVDETIQFAGVTNQFFTTVIQPEQPVVTSIWAKPKEIEIEKGSKTKTSVRAGLQLPTTELQPGDTTTLHYRIFIGPKQNTMLRKMENHWGEGWGDVMQYGWFSLISRFLNWLLNIYHNLIDGISTAWSWGLAIIILTITVRIFIWPLHAKSTRTMKRMSKLKPKMDELREKYKDDPNKLNMETMGLYRKYGINPLGGCLPMLLQIPIFFGFYRMLQYAVELRGNGFLWVDDLSQPDTLGYVFGIPLNLLPTVMAITSFLQIKMTPSTGDKMQQRILLLMPIMFFLFCYNFASALALYWTTQNIFSIGQTWLMGKMPEPELKAGKNASKKSWVQRMAEKQAEMQKMQRQGRRPGDMRDITPKKKRGPRTGG